MTAQPVEPLTTVEPQPTRRSKAAPSSGRPSAVPNARPHREALPGGVSADELDDVALELQRDISPVAPTVYRARGRRSAPHLRPYADPPRFELPERVIAAIERAEEGPHNDLRRLTAACRRVVHMLASTLPERTVTPAVQNLITRTAEQLLRDEPLRLPEHMLGTAITGAVNIYMRQFGPPPDHRYVGPRLHEELSRTGTLLDPLDHDANIEQFHPSDRRLGWLGPHGLYLDEIRLGRADDTILDRWMGRKILCDLRLGAATAEALGVPFLGVRLLPLHAPARAELCTAGIDGTIRTRLLRDALPDTVTLPTRPTRPGRIVSRHLLDDTSTAASTAASTANKAAS